MHSHSPESHLTLTYAVYHNIVSVSKSSLNRSDVFLCVLRVVKSEGKFFSYFFSLIINNLVKIFIRKFSKHHKINFLVIDSWKFTNFYSFKKYHLNGIFFCSVKLICKFVKEKISEKKFYRQKFSFSIFRGFLRHNDRRHFIFSYWKCFISGTIASHTPF